MTKFLIGPVPSDAYDWILTSDLVDFDGQYGLYLEKEVVGIDAIWNMLYGKKKLYQVGLKEKHYVQDGFRKFKEKFWSTVTRVKTFITPGGDKISKYEGDHQHALVKS